VVIARVGKNPVSRARSDFLTRLSTQRAGWTTSASVLRDLSPLSRRCQHSDCLVPDATANSGTIPADRIGYVSS
jgi:hypothetical protein